ncbi:hypothetical protein BK022_00070 [Methylorubrum extorquens]|uniref:Uncharacterized protein n=1 Tax=Methylorubrum extorquens TaxID=408 RepID=A0A1S1PAI3_METEX|nr:hypothetical protein BK022_00070 [Methylorubrum extorquens]
MNLKTLIAAALLTATALPALANDQGNANAEQQTQPTPSRGSTAGGPSHGADHPKNAPAGTAPAHTSQPHGHGDGSKH